MTTSSKAIETVVEFNDRQNSFHMTFHNSKGIKRKQGFVFSYGSTSIYCKTLAKAQEEMLKEWIKENNQGRFDDAGNYVTGTSTSF